MRIIILLFVIFADTTLLAAPTNSSIKENEDTHLMGSGAKEVDGPGVSKDDTKYKRTESMSRKELQKEEIGNNPTSTDTIEGKNSKKISD